MRSSGDRFRGKRAASAWQFRRKIERDLERRPIAVIVLGELLRRYVPPSTLPTPISNGAEVLEDSEPESSRGSLPRPTDGRLGDDFAIALILP